MKMLHCLFTSLSLCFFLSSLCQLYSRGMEYELQQNDAKQIKQISERILKINQGMFNNSVGAFDAIEQHLSKLKVERNEVDNKWYFAFKEVMAKVIKSQIGDFINSKVGTSNLVTAGTFFLDMYGLVKSVEKKDEDIVDKIEINSIRDLMDGIATRRTKMFPTDEITRMRIEKDITSKFRKEGTSFLNDLEKIVKNMEESLGVNLKSERGRYQTALFKLSIAEELISGFTKTSKPQDGFLQCIVKTNGCKGAEWRTNQNNCVSITSVMYKFNGAMSQQFESMVNTILNDFAWDKTIVDFNIPVMFKFYLNDTNNTPSNERYSYYIPATMNKVSSLANTSISYYYDDKLVSKDEGTYLDLKPLYVSLMTKIFKAKYGVRIGEKFLENSKIN